MVTRVLLSVNHELVRCGLAHILADSQDVVVGETSDGASMLGKLRSNRIDLVLLDISMSNETDMELIAQAKKNHPGLRILVLSMNDEVQRARDAIIAGASGYLGMDCSPDELMVAIRKVMATGKYINPTMAEKLAFTAGSYKTNNIELVLTRRELEVVRLLINGKNNREIAKGLFVSDKTISTHKTHILKKLGLNNSAELVRYAFQCQLLN